MNKTAKEKIIYLIRHGQSRANAGLRTENNKEDKLTELGRTQSELTASFALYEKPDLIVLSSFQRAIETASPLAMKFPQVFQKIMPVHEFDYLSSLKCLNTNHSDRLVLAENYWHRNDPDYADSGTAESFRIFFKRASLFISSLRHINSRKIYVFTHGNFIRAVTLLILFPNLEINGDTIKFFRAYSSTVAIPNCSVSKVIIKNTGEIFIKSPSVSHLPIQYRT